MWACTPLIIMYANHTAMRPAVRTRIPDSVSVPGRFALEPTTIKTIPTMRSIVAQVAHAIRSFVNENSMCTI